jgi:hypothetical protein
MFEVPVQFFSLSPAQVKRTSPVDGLRALAAVFAGRIRRYAPAPADAPAAELAASRHAQVR